jgi:hypothetical protein
LPYEQCTPSHDTLGRVLGRLKPAVMQAVLITWSLRSSTAGRLRPMKYARLLWMAKLCAARAPSLSSLSAKTHPAGSQAGFIRNHWHVENLLHRTLDVAFFEDACQVRDRNCAQNMVLLRRLAQTLLKHDPSDRSVRRKMAQFDRKPDQRNILLRALAKASSPPVVHSDYPKALMPDPERVCHQRVANQRTLHAIALVSAFLFIDILLKTL